jgi:hypothetical protein
VRFQLCKNSVIAYYNFISPCLSVRKERIREWSRRDNNYLFYTSTIEFYSFSTIQVFSTSTASSILSLVPVPDESTSSISGHRPCNLGSTSVQVGESKRNSCSTSRDYRPAGTRGRTMKAYRSVASFSDKFPPCQSATTLPGTTVTWKSSSS